MANGPQQQRLPDDVHAGGYYLYGHNKETLSGNKTLASDDEQVQILDPNGAARTISLPADEQGLEFLVVNPASAANALTVNDSDGNTVATVNQNEAARLYNYGSGWVALAGGSGPTQDT